MADQLPGSDLVVQGIEDLKRGAESIESLLVSIGRPRLIELGLNIPPPISDHPELRLYEILAETNPRGAHAQYNSWLRRLVSFERSAAPTSQGVSPDKCRDVISR